MTENEPAEFAGLWRKVDAATDGLTPKEKELLLACLWLGWLSTAQVDEIERGFKGSFTPEQAAVLVKYHAGSGAVTLLPRIVDYSIQTLTHSIRT